MQHIIINVDILYLPSPHKQHKHVCEEQKTIIKRKKVTCSKHTKKIEVILASFIICLTYLYL